MQYYINAINPFQGPDFGCLNSSHKILDLKRDSKEVI